MFKYELLAMVVVVLIAAWFAFGPSLKIGGFGDVSVGGFFKDQKWKWARVLGSVIALYAVIYFIPQTHWWVSWVWVDHHWWLVLLAHILIAWAYLILPDNPKNPADLRFARWVARAATILLLITFGGMEYVGDPLLQGKKIHMTVKGYLPRFEWVDATYTPGSNGMSNIGQLPAIPPPFPLNEEAWKEDLGFWMGHVATGEITQEEAEMMAAHCVAESKGCNQFESDGTTPRRNEQGSSAVCKYQIMLSAHAEIFEKFKNAGRGDYVDVSTANGCRNFAYELVMSNKSRNLKFNKDWVTTEDNAKAFLEWAHSVPPDTGDPSLRNPNAPLVARGGRGTAGTSGPTPENFGARALKNSIADKPIGKVCKEIRIGTSEEERTELYDLGYHPYLSTGPEPVYWRMFDQDGHQVGQINGRKQRYYITQNGVTAVSFQTYKATPEGKTATIFLTPCSNDE